MSVEQAATASSSDTVVPRTSSLLQRSSSDVGCPAADPSPQSSATEMASARTKNSPERARLVPMRALPKRVLEPYLSLSRAGGAPGSTLGRIGERLNLLELQAKR